MHEIEDEMVFRDVPTIPLEGPDGVEMCVAYFCYNELFCKLEDTGYLGYHKWKIKVCFEI